MSVKRFLLVEDDPDDQLLFAEMLHDVAPDCICDVVSNGQEALDYLSAVIPDLIVTDINMPKIDGIELARIIKTELKISIPVVTWSTAATDPYIADDLGIVATYTKPFDIQHLYALVKEIVAIAALDIHQ